MEQVIRFRGVCKISNEIVYGDLIHGVGAKSGKFYILPNRINLSGVKHCDPLDGVEIIPESVGQFTGLLDKHGKEIYCGDKFSSKWDVEVYQNDEGTFMVRFGNNPFINKPMTLKKYLQGRDKAGTSERDCVIIGNIHQIEPNF